MLHLHVCFSDWLKRIGLSIKKKLSGASSFPVRNLSKTVPVEVSSLNVKSTHENCSIRFKPVWMS